MANLPAGTYRAIATSWGLGESPKSETPEVGIVFALTAPDARGAQIIWHGYLTENAFKRTIESLRICGWKGDDLTNLDGLDENEVEIVVEEEEYEGKVRSRVRWVNRVGGGLASMKQMEPKRLKAFAAAMKAQIRALDAATGAPAATPPTKRPATGKPAPNPHGEPDPFQPGADDDIPF